MKKSVFCFATLLACACSAAEKPLVTSHRGARAEYDDNAVGGFRVCLEKGILGYETDVHMTADGKLVILHDSNLRRTTGVDAEIESITFEEARKARLLRSKEQIPTPEELFAIFKGRKDTFIEIEMKTNHMKEWYSGARGEDYCKKLQAAASKHLEPGTYAFTSFNVETVDIMKRLFPHEKVGIISGKPLTKELVDLGVEHKCERVAPILRGSTPEAGAYAKEKGINVTLWMVENIDDYKKAKAFGAGFTTSDHPMALLDAVRGCAAGE